MAANSVKQALADLESMERADLLALWEKTFGSPAPPRLHPSLLRSALAWSVQMKSQSEWHVQRIQRMLKQASGGSVITQAGTRIVREWKGRTHQVTVLPNGFEFESRYYRSLTSIAREITGTAWSGPRFFGVSL
jgi:hypothetical protein